ncbi:MAG: DUF4349 domain-containing protein [Oscillospiraceae bacterium]|nr:DUF4349 domain-containing protein [Oscillospiraceae bacterium]
MKKILALIMLAVLCVSLVSCGRRKEASDEYGGYYYDPAGSDYDLPAESGFYNSYNESKSDSAEYHTGNTGTPLSTGLKLTYSANIDIETLEYDKSLQAILDSIQKAGGFVSYRNEGGGYTSDYGSYIRKWVRMECRVPSGSYQAFLDGSAEFGNVTGLTSSMEDITSQYVDTEARLSSLNAQRERLTEMMKKAETVSDLIQIEAQLSETIYQIESYTARKNTFDNLVAYSTVTISLEEVSVVTHQAETFWDRLLATIGDSLRDFADFLENLLLSAIYLLPFAVVLAVLAVIAVKIIKKKKAKKAAQTAAVSDVTLPKKVD